MSSPLRPLCITSIWCRSLVSSTDVVMRIFSRALPELDAHQLLLLPSVGVLEHCCIYARRHSIQGSLSIDSPSIIDLFRDSNGDLACAFTKARWYSSCVETETRLVQHHSKSYVLTCASVQKMWKSIEGQHSSHTEWLVRPAGVDDYSLGRTMGYCVWYLLQHATADGPTAILCYSTQDWLIPYLPQRRLFFMD